MIKIKLSIVVIYTLAILLCPACNGKNVNNAVKDGSIKIVSDGQQPVKTINVSTEAAKKLISETKDLIILDVRTPAEVANGIIPNAINFNINNDDFSSKLATLDKNKPVLVYCKAGGRSSRASEMMANLGFVKIYNLEDGYDAWK